MKKSSAAKVGHHCIDNPNSTCQNSLQEILPGIAQTTQLMLLSTPMSMTMNDTWSRKIQPTCVWTKQLLPQQTLVTLMSFTLTNQLSTESMKNVKEWHNVSQWNGQWHPHCCQTCPATKTQLPTSSTLKSSSLLPQQLSFLTTNWPSMKLMQHANKWHNVEQFG